jgi:hypothetical protein
MPAKRDSSTFEQTATKKRAKKAATPSATHPSNASSPPTSSSDSPPSISADTPVDDLPVPLSFSPQPCWLHDRVLAELIPKERILGLLRSTHLKEHWDSDNFRTQFCALQGLENERAQITKYLGCFDECSGAFRVKYWRKPGKTGRATVWGSLGASSFRKPVRNTLLKGLYYDFDIVSCHPRLVVNICRAHNIQHDVVLDYCNNRKRWLTLIQDSYWPNRTPEQEAETYGHAKALMLRLCFMGTVAGFRKSVTIEEGLDDPPFLYRFRDQLATIATRVKEANPKCYEAVRSEKNRSLARGDADSSETSGASGRDVLSSMFALYL